MSKLKIDMLCTQVPMTDSPTWIYHLKFSTQIPHEKGTLNLVLGMNIVKTTHEAQLRGFENTFVTHT